MSLSLIKALPAIVASLALVATPSSCGKKPGGGTGISSEGICTVLEVRGPETLLPPGAEEAWVQGSLRATCNPSPLDMRSLLTLERRNPETGNWNQMMIGPPDTTVPGVLGHTFTVIFPFCLEGSWRMTAKITGTTPNRIKFKVDAPTRTSQIKC